MTAGLSQEQRFIAGIGAFDGLDGDVDAILVELDDWLARLIADLHAGCPVCPGFSAGSAPARQVEAVAAAIGTALSAWARRWTELEPTRALAGTLDRAAILLVFGKVNAGKSSLCNLMAERFAARGEVVEFLHVDAGRLVPGSERFAEGATETTARLQGVRLGQGLVLLDTPGLQSVTPDNAALTRRFADSADGVLWLTSSASPGQVQDLHDLSRELGRGKPLLPVITRSDVYEEDEVQGELVTDLRNKSATNRALQERDVTIRAEAKLVAMGLNTASLRPPVSVSVLMARRGSQTPAAMDDAGFERLFAALGPITVRALVYKRRKPAEILLHHLEESVLGTVDDDLLPRLAEMKATARAACDGLERQREQIIEAAWRDVAPVLPDLLLRDPASRDLDAIQTAASNLLLVAFDRAVRDVLGDYEVGPPAPRDARDPGEAAGSGDPMADASEPAPDQGAAHLYAVTRQRLHGALLRLAEDAIARCRVAIDGLLESTTRLEKILRLRRETLLALKAEIRTKTA